MNRIRLRIAERLVRAQQTAAILTTFNEVDMSRVMETRARFKDAFEKKHGVRLGFMSFFARACVLAMHDVPEVNAEIRGTDIVYHEHMYLGIGGEHRARPGGAGRAQRRPAGLRRIEREIARLADRGASWHASRPTTSRAARLRSRTAASSIAAEHADPGILRSAILGMHKIEKRAVVVDDQVVVRPMMYLALSYDHRLIDGEQAVTFLVRVKERLEDPERLLLAVRRRRA